MSIDWPSARGTMAFLMSLRRPLVPRKILVLPFWIRVLTFTTLTENRVSTAAAISAATSNQVIAFVITLVVCFLFTVAGASAVMDAFQGWAPPIIGLIWCLGRIFYAVGYVADANRRHIGFAICIFSVLILVILAAIGIVGAWSVA